MREIILSQNQVALVDDEDYEFLNQWKWCAMRNYTTFYAGRNSQRDSITHKQTVILMHRFILSAPNGIRVDHRNTNGLDNCRSNLRLATDSQNSMNKGKQSNNTSGYKGVTKCKPSNKWRAKVSVKGNLVYSEYFDDVVDAARAYDINAIKHHGEFAVLNFPETKSIELGSI